jgi:COP9 signalosome complex subunit 8
MASDAITAFCASSDYLGLAQYCENFELDLRHTEVDLATSVGVYKVHLVAYLLLSDLDRARFLWKRLPEEVKADTELQALWAVGKAMWQHQHSGVQAAASAYAWSTPFVAPLMNTLQTQYLERIFGQMSNAYATVTAETLATKLGVPTAKIHELANAAGWTADAVSGAYKPLQAESESQHTVKLEQLQQLTSYVSHLEQEIRP